ncbi:hypothetical protein [Streptomyces sp. CT34]|uniref:hypothetical protein n=1 Tax=Streptomyces sp. CT34 TaxID=1553907 RepID=UPI0007C6EA0E|nr:hypothetical protein [Streptomyces sp. CT34]
MIIALALLGYAALLGATGGRILRRGDWADRAPRPGIALWLAASFSVFAAAAIAGIALVVPTARASADRAGLLVLRAQYA